MPSYHGVVHNCTSNVSYVRAKTSKKTKNTESYSYLVNLDSNKNFLNISLHKTTNNLKANIKVAQMLKITTTIELLHATDKSI